MGSFLVSHRANLPPDQRCFTPVLTDTGLIDISTDTAHFVSILRHRVTTLSSISPGSSNVDSNKDFPPEIEEFRRLLMGVPDNEQSPAAPAPRSGASDSSRCVSPRLRDSGHSSTSSVRSRPSLRLDHLPSTARTYTSLREKVTSPIASWFGKPRPARERLNTMIMSSTSNCSIVETQD